MREDRLLSLGFNQGFLGVECELPCAVGTEAHWCGKADPCHSHWTRDLQVQEGHAGDFLLELVERSVCCLSLFTGSG
ncbi:unnamed protein product [Calypogeia fissa]